MQYRIFFHPLIEVEVATWLVLLMAIIIVATAQVRTLLKQRRELG
jgi:hypothetical protein